MAGRCGRYCAGVRHEPCARGCWRDPLNLAYVLLWLLPLFFARLLVATALQWLESSGAGRALYFLRFPRDRQEVARYPERTIALAQRHGAIPADAPLKTATLRLHEADAGSMGDPGKADRTFLLTISWGAAEPQEQVVLCCKTGALRGPKSARLLVAALGSHSREAAFYTHLAPDLRAAGVLVPTCYHSDVAGLLAHTFFLLEGVTGVAAVTDGASMGNTGSDLAVVSRPPPPTHHHHIIICCFAAERTLVFYV